MIFALPASPSCAADNRRKCFGKQISTNVYGIIDHTKTRRMAYSWETNAFAIVLKSYCLFTSEDQIFLPQDAILSVDSIQGKNISSMAFAPYNTFPLRGRNQKPISARHIS
jgi:hypothetical protein